MNTQPKSRPRQAACSTALLALAVALLACLFAAPAMAAPGLQCHDTQVTVTEFPVAVSTAQKADPRTDGSTVVWSDGRNGAAAIYAFSLDAQQESPVASAAGDLVAPAVTNGAVFWTDLSGTDPVVTGFDPSLTPSQFAIGSDPGRQVAADGDYVVFTDIAGGASHIYGYNRKTQQVFAICTADGDQSNPAISGDIVVWQDDRSGNWDIYGADLAQVPGSGAGAGEQTSALLSSRVGCGLPAEIAVCTADGDQTHPAIFGTTVVWQDDRDGDSDIYGVDLWQFADSGLTRAAHRVSSPPLGCDGSGEFAVCTADGDQVDPTISGSLVAWEDYRNGAGNADIYGCDLDSGSEFAVCTADGDQTSPSAGDGVVVWLDGRNGGSDVYGADVSFGEPASPPSTVWTSSSVLDLLLSAFQGLGVFDEWNYSLDNGATWASDGWLTLDQTSTIQMPAGDGPKTVYLKFANSADGSVIGPIVLTVWVDTQAPVTQALGNAVVARNHTAALKMIVRERLSPKATVTVVVRNLHGKVVKTLRLGQRPTNKVLVARFRCTLRRGTYHYRVLARDLAGNHQTKAGSRLLIVR